MKSILEEPPICFNHVASLLSDHYCRSICVSYKGWNDFLVIMLFPQRNFLNTTSPITSSPMDNFPNCKLPQQQHPQQEFPHTVNLSISPKKSHLNFGMNQGTKNDFFSKPCRLFILGKVWFRRKLQGGRAQRL